MNHRDMENLELRVKELERLAWSMFRALETFITLNELIESSEQKQENCDD